MRVPDICPRCEYNWIPCNERPGEYPGALSRANNKTEICSRCGEEEALEDMRGRLTPVHQWPIGQGNKN